MYKHTLSIFIFLIFQSCSDNSTDSTNVFPTEGLIAYYSFCGDAVDMSGNNHNGTVYEASLTKDRNGVDSAAYYFDGVDDHILIEANNEFILAAQGAIMAWVKPEYTGDNASILSNGISNNPTDNCYNIMVNRYSDKWQIIAYVGGQQINKSPDPILHDYNDWYFVTYQWDSSGNTSLFVDGNLEFKEPFLNKVNPDNNTTLYLALTSVAFYKGIIDELFIYKRNFTEEEIQYIYSLTINSFKL